MEPKRTTGRDIRRRNRSLLLSDLYFHGPLSRLELSERTGLSPATASNVTAELIEDEILVEAGRVESDGGRPRVLLRVDPNHGQVLGVVVAETGLQVGLFDVAMTPLAEITRPIGPGGMDPDVVADQVIACIREVLDLAGPLTGTILGVGVAVPGIVEQGTSRLVHGRTIGWDAVPFAQMLADRGLEWPVLLDNSARTLGQAEMWFGAGQGVRHAVVAVIDSGLGAAVINNGVGYQGASSSAIEWGHTTIMFGGRECRCGSRGCLEAYVGADGVLDRYRRARRGRPAPGADEMARLTALLDAAGRSEVAADLLAETADLLGAGIADLVNLFNPERVILSGWAGIAVGTRMLPRIQQSVQANTLPHFYRQTDFQLGSLGERAGVLGAATLPIAEFLIVGR